MMVFNSVSTYIKETYVNYDTNTVTSNYSTNNTISTLNGTSMKMESDSSVDGVKITATKKGTYYVLKGDNSTTMTPNVVLVTTENTVVAQFSRYSNVNMVIKIG